MNAWYNCVSVPLFVKTKMIKAVVIQGPTKSGHGMKELCYRQFPNLTIVDSAEGVEQGIKAVRGHSPNLVLLDVDLPDGSGFQIFEATQDMRYEKIILSSDPGYAIKAARFYVADYLLKPLKGDELCTALEKLLFARREYPIQRLYENHFCMRSWVRLSHVAVEEEDRQRLVDTSEIVRIRDEEDHRRIFMVGNAMMETKTSLRALENRLAFNKRFKKIGRTDMVNLDHVLRVDERATHHRKVLVTRDGYRIVLPLNMEQSLLRLL